jgi:hypothetical protein
MALAASVQQTPQTDRHLNAGNAFEKHCSVREVAKMWGLSENTIRRIFANEPG